jgi:hypothetical protein
VVVVMVVWDKFVAVVFLVFIAQAV